MPTATHAQRIQQINRRRRMQSAQRNYRVAAIVLAMLAWQGGVAGLTGSGTGVETFATFSNNAVQLVIAAVIGWLAEKGLSDRDSYIETHTLAQIEDRTEVDEDDDRDE